MVIKDVITPEELRSLHRVIDIYIETGQPVSSRMIKSLFKLQESTAGIRKHLHKLEELGLLCKPHTSAGRVPTDLGFRIYVDEIRSLGALDRRISERVRKKLAQDWHDMRELLSAASRLLSEVTEYMGLTLGIVQSRRMIERFEIIALEGCSGSVVLVIEPGEVRRIFVQFDREYSPSVVERASALVNERISGHPLEEAPERLAAVLQDGTGAEREIAMQISRETAQLFELPYDMEYSFCGIENFDRSSELGNPKVLRNLVRLMGERTIMLNVLKNRLDAEVAVTIGGENELPELEDFSLITRRFATAEHRGILGVLGPVRMSYRMVLSLLDLAVDELRSAHLRQ